MARIPFFFVDGSLSEEIKVVRFRTLHLLKFSSCVMRIMKFRSDFVITDVVDDWFPGGGKRNGSFLRTWNLILLYFIVIVYILGVGKFLIRI